MTRAEIIAVGTELLTPLRSDTNALYLTSKLLEIGIDTGARITVADDGPGMDAEDRERAFLRFTTSNPNGTGLGLAIVHRLVTSNGGTAWLTETPGGGLTAVLEFPGMPTTPTASDNPSPAALSM